MSRIFGFLLLGLAALLCGFGIYALAKRDVQGGADEAGMILVTAALVAAVVGGTLIRFRKV